jgi:pimeloyl-ACP methyl ester carboxylesterase
MSEINHRTVETNGIRMHVAEQGAGPLVILCHGFPESWYSWRHQLTALSAAGFHAVAPDMRGYGRTDAPTAIEAYTLLHLVGDMVGLVTALGETSAVIAGHDWGAPVAWHAALLRPDVFHAVIGLSVPFRPRGSVRPTAVMPQTDEAIFYQLYFQTPGVAEAELERDVRATIRRLAYSGSGDAPGRQNVAMVRRGGGLLDQAIDPDTLPPWLTEADIELYAAEFGRTGFRGGLNWYRNLDRNWALTAAWHDAKVTQPALFIAGTNDAVITGSMGKRALDEMDEVVPNLKARLLLEGAGHWIQQERPAEVNAVLVGFAREHLV